MSFDPVSFIMGRKAGGGGGGSSPWTKIAEKDFEVNTSSTSATDVGTIAAGAAAWTSAKMVYVRVRDKAGKRNGYFYGSDSFMTNTYAAGSGWLYTNVGKTVFSYVDSEWKGAASSAGVYLYSVNRDGVIAIMSKYNANYGTIDGTYHIEVYTLDWPDNVSPFA